jgi:hypothetical protein
LPSSRDSPSASASIALPWAGSGASSQRLQHQGLPEAVTEAGEVPQGRLEAGTGLLGLPLLLRDQPQATEDPASKWRFPSARKPSRAGQLQGIGQPPDGVRVRPADPAPLQVPQRPLAQPGPLGQRLLGQPQPRPVRPHQPTQGRRTGG